MAGPVELKYIRYTLFASCERVLTWPHVQRTCCPSIFIANIIRHEQILLVEDLICALRQLLVRFLKVLERSDIVRWIGTSIDILFTGIATQIPLLLLDLFG